MASGNPNPYDLGSFRVSMNDLRDNIFNELSLTSQFKASLFLSSGNTSADDLSGHLARCGLVQQNDLLKYDFLCAEAVLPGSTFDMAEEYGSRQGVIERFPTRRVYSDFNLTFYVDANYNLIRLFEEWMNFIDPLYSSNNLRYTGGPNGQSNSSYMGNNSFFRFKYPNLYKKIIGITKFERNYTNPITGAAQGPVSLTYQFVDAFPTNLTALPLSYEGSTITKTTVNFSYSRYIVMKNNNSNALRNETEFLNSSTPNSALSGTETPLDGNDSQVSNRAAGNQPEVFSAATAAINSIASDPNPNTALFDSSSLSNISREIGQI